MSLPPDKQLTGKALSMAVELREHPKNILFHSDQGSHYTNIKYWQSGLRYIVWLATLFRAIGSSGDTDGSLLSR